MDESNAKQGQPKKVSRCDSKQLVLLKKCSEKKDMTEWNNWRNENPKEEIWLQGAKLRGALLEKADLHGAHLKEADLEYAHLEEAWLAGAHLEGANFRGANLKGADLHGAHLKGADLTEVHLERAYLMFANLEGAKLLHGHLENADLWHAHLEDADLWDPHLEGARFGWAIVDGSTLICRCHIDQRTDFRGVGLDSCRIDPGTKQLLEYNIRRMNWKDWYIGESDKKWVGKMRQFLTCPVRLFWCMSDYGRSTIRILAVFLALAIVFAVSYWAKPDCVMVNGQVGGLRNFLHALYFSVVTMTTLGFGDIAANPQSSCGQVLLMLQVFCGYFLLGAIITRLSILFTAGGPAGRFSKKEK